MSDTPIISGVSVCHGNLVLPPGAQVGDASCEFNPDDCCAPDTTAPNSPPASDGSGERYLSGFWVQTRTVTIPHAEVLGQTCHHAVPCSTVRRTFTSSCTPGVMLPEQLRLTILHYPDNMPVMHTYMGDTYRTTYFLQPNPATPGLGSWGGYAIRKPVFLNGHCGGGTSNACWYFNFQLNLGSTADRVVTYGSTTKRAKTVLGVSDLCFRATAYLGYVGLTTYSTHYAGEDGAFLVDPSNETYFSTTIQPSYSNFNWLLAPEPGWSLDPFYMEFRTAHDSWFYGSGTVPNQDNLGLSPWAPPFVSDLTQYRAGVYILTE